MADRPEPQGEEVEREARGWAVVFGMVATGAVLTGLALAVGVGIAAVVNYNGTTGILGAAFGVTAWLSLATGRWSR